MAKNLGEGVSASYDGLGYAFDKVVFQQGKPILDGELNLAQELQEILTQRSTAHLPSGWLSRRPYHTDSNLTNAFYTQDPEGSKPEVALVNGWPIYVSNTNTPLQHVNKIELSDNELRSGSRVDGVFLEVWRALISTEDDSDEIIKPQDITKVSDLHGIFMYNENIGWAMGNNGIILKTMDGGINWHTVSTPVNTNYNKVQFRNLNIGYAVGDNGIVLKSNDSGESWFVLSTPVEDNLKDLFIINETTVCAVGDNGIVLLTEDGHTFSSITETDNITDNLSGVFFFDSSVGWAVGENGVLIVTKDGGHIWERFIVTDTLTNVVIDENFTSVAFYNLNDGLISGDNGLILKTSDSGFTWANMSGRIDYEGSFQSIQDIFPTSTINFNRVFVKPDFPVEFTISLYPDSRNYFKNAVYKVSPSNYPNSLVFEYTGVLDNKNYVNVLDLAAYPTSEALRDAVNEIVSPYLATDSQLSDEDRQKVRVFESTLNYNTLSNPSDFKPTTGSISGLNPATLSFSVEDKAWISGDNGTFLLTSNSGARWELIDLNIGQDLKSLHFVTNSFGWFVGDDVSIIQYNPEVSAEGIVQDSDLRALSKGRIFPEGNIDSNAEEYLPDNIINPQVGVETTKRVQIQYRVRIVDGVNSVDNPEAGLGLPYVFSLGPNVNTSTAGNYTYNNMGTVNGDYGLWRARCRNTVDGYSYSIPMFFVSRRNSAPFNLENNINGSTYFDLNAIRPDGLTYEEIVDEDVIDVRRQINIDSYSYFLEKNLDKLLGNRLDTFISDKDQNGLQYGTSILAADSYFGINDINNVVQGVVTSSANIDQDQKVLDPNLEITESELTFGPLDNALYHNDPAYYSAFIVRDAVVTTEPVDGTWEGLGTNTVKFNISSNFSPAGSTEGDTLEGIEYQFTAHYINYGNVGLGRVPKDPISIKYRPDDVITTGTQYFNAISSTVDSEVYETLGARVEGWNDYVTLNSAVAILNNKDDQDLYKVPGAMSPDDPDFARSVRKYRGQQFRGSLLEYHYFFRNEVSSAIVRVPKNLDGYAVFNVIQVKNVNGSVYKISTDYAADLSVRDRETVDSTVVTDNVVIYLDEAFTIPAGAMVEVVMEVVAPDVYGGDPADIGITETSLGENQSALRTPFSTNFNVASKGVGGMYTSVLYPITFGNITNEFTIDMANPAVEGLDDSIILGIASNETRLKDRQPYLWFKSSKPENDYFTTLAVANVEGLGTSVINITLDPDRSIDSGDVLVPLLVKLSTLQGLADTSSASVFYRYVPYQTLGNLPSSLKVEILKNSENVYISNMGTGASNDIEGVPYEIPVEHIAVNDDSVINDNMFSNVDDLDFATFSVDTGFIKMPAMISRNIGEDLILSSPNNVGDRVGRTFYTECSEEIIYQAENLTISTPRKVFIPMLARIRTDVTTPFLRGEIVLLVFSKVYKARIDNKTGFYEDQDEEYVQGYFESADTAISVYRLFNKPIVRK